MYILVMDFKFCHVTPESTSLRKIWAKQIVRFLWFINPFKMFTKTDGSAFQCPVPINNLNLRIKTEPVTVKFEPFSPRALRNKDLSSSQNVFKLKCAVNKSCLKASLFKAGLLCEKYNLFARTTYWHSFGFCKLMFRSIKIK